MEVEEKRWGVAGQGTKSRSAPRPNGGKGADQHGTWLTFDTRTCPERVADYSRSCALNGILGQRRARAQGEHRRGR